MGILIKYTNFKLIILVYKLYKKEYNLTCLMNVIGFCPIAWQSPIFALSTSLKGFSTP